MEDLGDVASAFVEVAHAVVWATVAALPEPLGYDGATIPFWKDGPASPQYGVLRLDPWRLRVFPAVYGRSEGAEGEILTWSESG